MFMTSTENQRETFWKVFDGVLKEKVNHSKFLMFTKLETK